MNLGKIVKDIMDTFRYYTVDFYRNYRDWQQDNADFKALNANQEKGKP